MPGAAAKPEPASEGDRYKISDSRINPRPQNPSASAIVHERLTVCVVHLDRDGLDFGALLLPAEDGFADAIHGDFGDLAGALRTGVDHF